MGAMPEKFLLIDDFVNNDVRVSGQLSGGRGSAGLCGAACAVVFFHLVFLRGCFSGENGAWPVKVCGWNRVFLAAGEKKVKNRVDGVGRID
jgi:hypothetical protein